MNGEHEQRARFDDGARGEAPSARETRWRPGFDASDQPAHVPPPRRFSGVSGLWAIFCVVVTVLIAVVGIVLFAGEYAETGRISEDMRRPGLALLAIVVLFLVAGVRMLRRRRDRDRS